MAEDKPRTVLAALIFSLVTLQGLTINLMPLLFGTMAESFHVNLRQQGQLQSFFLAGGILGLLVSGYITERIGARRSGMLAAGLIGLGLLLLGLAGTYERVLLAAAMIGLGDMWILAVYSAIITARFAKIRQRMFMFSTAVFAGSATVSSALLGKLLVSVPDWHLIFLGLACLTGAWFVGFFLITRRVLCILDPTALTEGQNSPEGSGGLAARVRQARIFLADGLFNRSAFWLLGVLVVLDIVAAGNIVAWTARFFQTEYGVGEDQAGLMLTASAAGVFVGRLFMGTFVSGRVGDRLLLGICYAAGILMYTLILIIPGYRLGLLLIFLNGAFIAAQAPTMYAIASDKFGRRAATAIPLIDAIGVLGWFATPALVGALADHYGLGAVLWFIPAVGAVLVAIVFAWEIVDRPEPDNA